MIQTRTALCVIAAVASGLFLYSGKRQALMIDREIGMLLRATADLHTRTALLRAEWASMLEPDRLQAMSSEHLPLQPIAPAQFVKLDDLGTHLPAPEPAPALATLDADAAAADGAAGSLTQNEAVAAQVPALPAAAPGTTASLVPQHPAAPRAVIPRFGTLPAGSDIAAAKPPARSLVTPHRPVEHIFVLAGGQGRAATMLRPVVANPYKAIARPARALQPAPATARGGVPSRPYVASALGNAVALSPPVPYGQ